MVRSSIRFASGADASPQESFDPLFQFFAGSAQTSFDGALGQRPLTRDVAHALVGEVEVFQELRVRAPEPREPPVDDRRGARIVDRRRRFDFEAIEECWARRAAASGGGSC
jgi:hypothetical protein